MQSAENKGRRIEWKLGKVSGGLPESLRHVNLAHCAGAVTQLTADVETFAGHEKQLQDQTFALFQRKSARVDVEAIPSTCKRQACFNHRTTHKH